MLRRTKTLFAVGSLLAAGATVAVSLWGGGTEESASASYDPIIDPANFVRGIDNPYLPLEPGTTFVYRGTSDGEVETSTVAVTNERKVILGVTCVVVLDLVEVSGELKEKTLDWYAQDREGNVWYFGERTEEYENGAIVSTEGSWEAGVDGAKAGILMKADPKPGETYRQEYYVGEAEDWARVLRLNEDVTVAYASFENVLVTKDSTPLSPGLIAEKFYARGVGLIMDRLVSGGQERLELIEIKRSEP